MEFIRVSDGGLPEGGSGAGVRAISLFTGELHHFFKTR